MGLALIAFDESELDTIKNLLKEAQLEGSDGYLYILSQGSIEKKAKCPIQLRRRTDTISAIRKAKQSSREY